MCTKVFIVLILCNNAYIIILICTVAPDDDSYGKYTYISLEHRRLKSFQTTDFLCTLIRSIRISHSLVTSYTKHFSPFLIIKATSSAIARKNHYRSILFIVHSFEWLLLTVKFFLKTVEILFLTTFHAIFKIHGGNLKSNLKFLF